MNLSFKPKDFKDFKSFERAVKAQMGERTYVGTDSMIIYVEYPAELKAMIRPFPAQEQYEFSFTVSKCSDCSRGMGFEGPVCMDCEDKRRKKLTKR